VKPARKAISTTVAVVIVVVILVIAGLGGYLFLASQPSHTTSTTSSTSSVSPVTIGIFLPLTGSQALDGQVELNGIKIAVSEINSQGGITSLGGAQIQLKIVDTTSDASQGPSLVAQALSSLKIPVAIVPSVAGLTEPILAATTKAGVPAMTTIIDNEVTDGRFGRYAVSIDLNVSYFSTQFVQFFGFLNSISPLNKVAIVHDTSPGFTGFSNFTQGLLTKAGYTVVLNEGFNSPLTDAAPVVTKIIQSGANFIILPADVSDGVAIVTTLKAQGSKAVILGVGTGTNLPDFKASLGNNVNGIIAIDGWASDQNPTLNSEYQQLYGTFIPPHAGMAYIEMWTIKAALEKAASTDPAVVTTALHSLNLTSGPAYDTQRYPILFTSYGRDTAGFAFFMQWQNGALVTIYPTSVAKAPPVWPPPS
jgi:branched-chain amino acid transport system substrate-binding protein